MFTLDIEKFHEARKIALKRLNSREFRHEYRKQCYVNNRTVEGRSVHAEFIKTYATEMIKQIGAK